MTVRVWFFVEFWASAGWALATPIPKPAGRPDEDPKSEYLLYLDVDAQGRVYVADKEQPLDKLEAVGLYLKEKYRDLHGENKEAKGLVIIRAHRETPFRDVYSIMTKCKEAGFIRWQIRAQKTTE